MWVFYYVGVVVSIISTSTLGDGDKPCTTSACMEMNQYLLARVDQSKNPCINFYQFACGKYYEATTEVENTQLKINQQVSDILREPAERADYKELNMTKEMFEACIQHDSNVEDLRKLIEGIGGWSLLDEDWKPENFNLGRFFSNSVSRGYYPKSLFTVDVLPDDENTAQKIVTITDRNSVNLDNVFPEIYHEYEFDSSYVSAIVRKLRMSKRKAQADFQQYEELNEKINQIYGRSGTRERYTVSNLETTYPNIPWKEIFTNMFQPTTVLSKYNVSVHCGECIASIDQLIHRTSASNLASYLMWSLVIKVASEVDNDIFQEYWGYTDEQKVNHCVRTTTGRFARVVDHQYYRRHFNLGFKSDINAYDSVIKQTMRTMLGNTTWLDPDTRKRMIEKVYYTLHLKAVVDDEIKTQQKIEKYYVELTIDPKSYFPSLLNLSKFVNRKNMVPLRERSKPLYLASTVTSAGYDLAANVVQLGASTLTGIFYPKCKPQYLIFSTIGFSISHEMHHALDNFGYEYDADGLYNVNWMEPSAKKKLQEKFDCIEKQYSTYLNIETGNKVKGKATLRENFCDVGGMAVAHQAYEKAINEGFVKDQRLPDFQKYNKLQMFWISFAAAMCKQPSRKTVLAHEQYGTHAESRVRVNGIVRNSNEFAKDFECAPGTGMNPSFKCVIWS